MEEKRSDQIKPTSLLEEALAEKMSTGKIAKLAVSAIAISMAFFHLYTSYFGTLPSWQHRSFHVGVVLILIYCLYPARKGKPWNIFLDGIPLLLSTIITYYMYSNHYEIVLRAGRPDETDQVLGMVLVVLVIEATRRTLGIAMPILAVFFWSYIFIGPHFPGLLGHPGFSYRKMIDQMFNSLYGLFGVPIYVSSTVLVLFIIFGAFLLRSGAGQAFIDFTYSLTGSRRGGPALTAVGASALIGSITGNGVANVAITGTFSIPLMRRMGYNANFAGAVEAVASQGGQILPPIMGASAFMIAELTGISYVRVIAMALIPALLYFAMAGIMIYVQAKKSDLRGVPKEELPDWKKIMLGYGHLFLPLIIIVGTLVLGYSAMRAGSYGIASVFVLAMLKKETRFNVVGVLAALEKGMRDTVVVACACTCAGIIVGSIVLTGLGIRFSRLAIQLGGGELLPVLIMMMIASLILGMGMTTVSAYLILAVLGVPALVAMDVPIIAAHLFCFYFAIVSGLTPPVALTSYAAAGIARGHPQQTAFWSVKLGLGGFVIPYMFIYNPALVLIGSTTEIVIAVITALIGCISFAAAVQGYLLIKAALWERALLFVSAFLLIGVTGPMTALGGALLVGAAVYQNYKRGKLTDEERLLLESPESDLAMK